MAFLIWLTDEITDKSLTKSLCSLAVVFKRNRTVFRHSVLKFLALPTKPSVSRDGGPVWCVRGCGVLQARPCVGVIHTPCTAEHLSEATFLPRRCDVCSGNTCHGAAVRGALVTLPSCDCGALSTGMKLPEATSGPRHGQRPVTTLSRWV